MYTRLEGSRIPRKSTLVKSLFAYRDEDKSFTDSFLIAAQEGKNIVVIGSSFISMELVQAVSKRKLASINVIGMEEYPFEPVLGKEIGKALKKVWVFLCFVQNCGHSHSISDTSIMSPKASNST